jgi:hypothetical protein
MVAIDELLEACRLAPNDDAPRLAWASAVGGERGELVALQCELSRGGLAPAEVGARLRRERALLERHGAEWAGLRGLGPEWCHHFEFRRGFVEETQLVARTFTEQGAEVFRRAPLLRSVVIASGLWVERHGNPLDELRRLLDAPMFSRLRGLDLVQVGSGSTAGVEFFTGHGDEALRVLVESGALAQLRAFGLIGSALGRAGVEHLGLLKGELHQLERLTLYDGRSLDEATIGALLGRAPRLKSLDLDRYALDLATLAPALPPLTELRIIGQITDEGVEELARSRAAATLERLWLWPTDTYRDLPRKFPPTFGALAKQEPTRGEVFRRFPRLRTLSLSTGAGSTERIALDLAKGFPSLRRVQLRWYRSAGPALHELARALGPQLEQLDLEPNPMESADDAIEALQASVAGEVVCRGRRLPERWF